MSNVPSSPLKAIPHLSEKIDQSPFLGFLPKIQKDPLALLLKAQDHFPDLCQMRLGFFNVALIFDAELAKLALQSHAKNYSKETFITRSLKLVLGKGLLTNDGSSWIKYRKLIQPLFHFERLRSYRPIIRREVEHFVAGWKSKIIKSANRSIDVNLSRELLHLALVLVGQSILGRNLSHLANDIDSDFAFLSEQIYKGSLNPFALPLWIPTPNNVKLSSIKKRLHTIVDQLIDESSADQNDLLSLLLRAEDPETGEKMPREHIRDEVMTLFIAGHETTAHSLLWFFHTLEAHPAIEEGLVTDSKANPSFADSDLLKNTLSEVLRMHSVAWTLVRKSIADEALGPYQMKAGTLVVLSPFATHKHPRYWKNPLSFDPKRFNSKESVDRHKFAYMPFGGGPRICIGNHLARLILEEALAQLIAQFEIRFSPKTPAIPHPTTTLGMKGDIQATVKMRKQHHK